MIPATCKGCWWLHEQEEEQAGADSNISCLDGEWIDVCNTLDINQVATTFK
jgi:hypothetical protein